MLKKLSLVMLAVIMVISTLAGCVAEKTGDKNTMSGTSASATTAPTEREIIEITVTESNTGNLKMAPKMKAFLEEKFKIKINIEYFDFSYDTIVDKYTAVFAAGDEPMFITQVNHIQALINQMGTEGRIYAVNSEEILSKVPNYMTWYTDEQWEFIKGSCSAVDGNLYYFSVPLYPSALLYNTNYWIYKKSGFDQLGLEFPDTMDGLLDVMRQIKASDPNANVLCTLYGLMNCFGPICSAYRTSEGMYVDPETDELVFGPVTDNYRDALKFLRTAFSEGLCMYKDVNFWDDAYWREVAATPTHWIWTALPIYTEPTRNFAKAFEADPGMKYEVSYVWPSGYEGKPAYVKLNNPGAYWGPAITKKATGEALERILEMCDWLAGEEGRYFGTMGLKGDSYVLNGEGKGVYDPKIKNNYNPTGTVDYNSEYFTPIKMIYYLPQYMAYKHPTVETDKIVRDYLAQGKIIGIYELAISPTLEEAARLTELDGVINGQVFEFRNNFLNGIVTEANWDEYKQALEKAGLSEMMALRKAIYERNRK